MRHRIAAQEAAVSRLPSIVSGAVPGSKVSFCRPLTTLAQFPNDAVEGGEYFGTVQSKDSSLTPCINLAIKEMKDDGTLSDITDEWLSKKTNVGEVPVWSK